MRIIAIISAALLLQACASNRAYDVDGQIIAAGMSRSKVDELIGAPDHCGPVPFIGEYCEYEKVRIIFKKDRVDQVTGVN